MRHNTWNTSDPPTHAHIWGVHPERGVRKYRYDKKDGWLFLIDQWYKTEKPNRWLPLDKWPFKEFIHH